MASQKMSGNNRSLSELCYWNTATCMHVNDDKRSHYVSVTT